MRISTPVFFYNYTGICPECESVIVADEKEVSLRWAIFGFFSFHTHKIKCPNCGTVTKMAKGRGVKETKVRDL